jgi:PAS domain S-box-containing protein
MKDQDKNKAQLIAELEDMHQRISELEQSEEKFRTLAEQSPNMIFINKMGRVVYANKKSEEVMGYTREEYYAHDFDFLTLIAPESVEIVTSAFSKHMKGDEIEPYEYTLITKDGKRINAIITTSTIDYEGEMTLLGIITDITERVRAEEEVQRQMQVQVALRKASAAISSALDLETVLARIAKEMGRVINATSAYINSYEPSTMMSTVIAEYIGPEANDTERVPGLGEVYPEDNPVEFFERMRSGQHDVSHLDDADLTEYEQSEMQEYGVKSMLYIPLQVKGQLVGYTELWETRQRREFMPAEIRLCQDLAQQAAIAIENARLFEQAQHEITERKRAEEELAQHRDHLEELVKQRTSELQKQMEEQRNILELMAGREVRMANLKVVIAKLRQQLKDAGMTPIANDPLLDHNDDY